MVQFYSLDTDEEDNHQQPTIHPDSTAFAAEKEYHNSEVRMTPKVPATFDGQTSWLGFEDLIDDCLGITTLTPK